MQKLQGWSSQGGTSVVIPGTQGSGSQTFQESYPGCTITVYEADTLTLSTIYSDDAGTAKANPFVSDTSTGYWFFFAANGLYDVKFSNGGIASPFTLGGFQLFDPEEDSIEFAGDVTVGDDLTVAGNIIGQGGITIADTLYVGAASSFNDDLTVTGVLRVNENIGVGTATFGTSADNVLGLANGTVPSTSPADMVQLFSVDLSAANATLGIRTETAVATDVVTASTHTLSVKINGTTYKILLST